MKNLFIFLITSIFIFNSCNKDGAPSESSSDNEPRILETTVVATTSTINSLILVDSTSLTFHNTDQVRNLAPGEIIVINKDQGYLRKIVSIQATENNFIVITEQARLDEVITQGSFENEILLQPNNLMSTTFSNDRIKLTKTSDQFSLIFDNYEFGLIREITIAGHTEFPAPKLKINATFNNGLESLDASVEINASTTFSIKTKKGVSFSGSYTPPQAIFTFAPITIFIGILPVIITPQLSIVLGVGSEIESKMEVTYNVSTQVIGGISFQRSTSSLTPYATFNQSCENKSILIPAKGKIEGSILLPKVEFLFYSLAGPFIDLQLYGGTKDKNLGTIALYYGINLEGGLETSILGQFNLPDLQWKTERNLFERELLTYTFNTPPNSVDVLSPPNNSINQSVNSLLSWDCSDPDGDAITYDVYFGTANNPPIVRSNLTTKTYNPGSLTNNTKYYWKILAKDDRGASTTGDIWNFITSSTTQTPPTVTTLSITNVTSNSAIGGGNVTVQGSSSVTSRGVCWSTLQNPTTSDSKTTDGTGIGNFTSSITGLGTGTTYYVRAYATNSAGTNYGSQVSFTTTVAGTSPPSPILTSPSNGATSVSISPMLQWNASNTATSYTLQVSTSSSFGSYTYNQNGLTSNSQQMSGLNNNTKYYWRVSASNSYGTSTYSSIWNFTTLTSGTAPSAPTLVSPEDNETNQSISPMLIWNTSSDAKSYTLQVSKSSSFSNYAYNENNLTSTSQQIAGLDNSTIYFWRVSATNDYGSSTFSSVWNFTTADGSGFPCVDAPTVTYEGKTYNTIQIGSQCWLKENLDVGTMIQGGQDQSNNGIVEKYCYENDPNYCLTYGGLYQWNEAMQYETTEGTRGICPSGWHLPTYAEFTILSDVVGGSGNALKEVGQGSGSGAGTNASGFTALLAGYRNYDGGVFYVRAFATDFWTSNSQNNYFGLNSSTDAIPSGYIPATYGTSIRCLKD